MVNFQRKERYDWEDLLTIMRILRAPGGCPWDREQTHQSIRRNFLEETYEALDAIDRDSAPDMQEELGDVLLQVVFHAAMEEERGRFTPDDVVDGVAQKLVFRHAHVFGSAQAAADSAEALEDWEAQKSRKRAIPPRQTPLRPCPIRCRRFGGQKNRFPLREGRVQLELRDRGAGEAGRGMR